MINQIEMYKVGFGDCFICSDEDNVNKMLVDCGSSSVVHSDVIEYINHSLKHSNNYLMITHFHNDHFNILQKLDPNLKFSEIYLPNFFTRNIIRLELIMIASNIKKFKNHAYKFAINLLKIIPNLAQHFGNRIRISFLNKNYGLHKEYVERNQLDKLRILWPDMSCIEQNAKKLNEKLGRVINAENRQFLYDFADRYMKIISQLIGKTDNSDINFKNSDENKDNIDIFYLLNEFVEKFKLEIPYSLYKTISNFQNEICLCFDNVNEHNKKPVLFLSDIKKSRYKNLCQINDLAPYYFIIKVPHHGTKSYYISNLPDSNTLLIPNDNAKSKWSIYDEYFVVYNDRNILTNSYCCMCSYCKGGSCCKISNACCILQHIVT